MSKLTALQVKNAKPGRHADGKGLYLLVKDTGARSWVLRIVVHGRRRDFGLGPVDLVTLQEARDKAIEGRKLVRAGLDPGNEWKRRLEVVPTFEAAAREYHGTVKAGWRNGKHGAQWLSTLEAHAFPKLGRTPVDQIDADAIQRMLLPIWLVTPETARRVRQRTFAVLDYSHSKGWRSDEAPARAVSKGLPRQPAKLGNFAAMPYAELPALVAGLRSEGASIGRRALEFTLLNAARSGETRGATWEEMDLDGATWNIPGKRMKGGRPHSKPLCEASLAILREMALLSTGKPGALVFPGAKGKPISDATMHKAFKAAGGDGYTVHGSARSGFRDWAAEQTSFPPDWAEAQLAHALKNKTEAAYLRTAYLDQRRKLMDAWADYLGGGSNVVRLVASA